MASSETEICNMAIAHLGVGKRIASLDERSQESNICNTFYEVALHNTLRDFTWPFCSKIVALGLFEEDPTDEWAFSYRYPSECEFLRRILSGNRNDNADTIIPYKIYADDDGKLIYTDMEDAEVEYTFVEEDPSKYPSDFVMALSYQLAALIAPTICGVQRIELVDRMLQLSSFWVGKAAQAGSGEEKQDRVPESEFIRAREGVVFEDVFPRRTI